MTGIDLTGLTFDELTAYAKQWADTAKTRCPEKAAELEMIVRVMEERGPGGDAIKTRQYIAETINSCTRSGIGGSLAVVGGIGLLAWFLLR